MSTPWSRVQSDGGSTRETGASGNTQLVELGCEPLSEVPPDFAFLVSPAAELLPVEGLAATTLWRLAAARTLARSVWAVLCPTTPLAGRRRAARWNSSTPRCVETPK